MTTRRSSLDIRSIAAGYGKRDVIADIGLRVPEGDIVCILGANGTGKSTLLKTILGYLRCRKGEIWFREEPIENWPIHRRIAAGIRFVPQGRVVFEKMSVKENLLLGAHLALPRSSVRNRIDQAIAMFPQLEALLPRRAGVLSGGERQMVAVGRSCMADGSLLILDEPSAGLSPRYIHLLYEGLAKLHATGISMLLAEQNAAKALEFSDYAYVLDRGHVLLKGEAADMRKDPLFRDSYLRAAHLTPAGLDSFKGKAEDTQQGSNE